MSGAVRLHLGCFNCPADGWVNTDVTPHLRVARVPGLAWLLHRVGRMAAERYAEHRAGVFRRVRYLDAARPWPGFWTIARNHCLWKRVRPECRARQGG